MTPVKVWQERVEIPTYETGPQDIHPMFPGKSRLSGIVRRGLSLRRDRYAERAENPEIPGRRCGWKTTTSK